MDKVLSFLKNLSPNHEPVAYLFLALLGYQILVKNESVPQEWVQYLVKAVLAGGLRQIVTPLAKLEDAE